MPVAPRALASTAEFDATIGTNKSQGLSMDGLDFVRGDHLSIAEGCYLPRADLLGLVQARLHELVYQNPDVKAYVPNLLDVDLFVTWDGDKFMLLVSAAKRGHLPARGMETKHLPKLREAGNDVLGALPGFVDIPPRHNSCRLHRNRAGGGDEGRQCRDTDKHSRTRQWHACCRPRAPRRRTLRARLASGRTRSSDGSVRR